MGASKLARRGKGPGRKELGRTLTAPAMGHGPWGELGGKAGKLGTAGREGGTEKLGWH